MTLLVELEKIGAKQPGMWLIIEPDADSLGLHGSRRTFGHFPEHSTPVALRKVFASSELHEGFVLF
jgi:hypothetical protein